MRRLNAGRAASSIRTIPDHLSRSAQQRLDIDVARLCELDAARIAIVDEYRALVRVGCNGVESPPISRQSQSNSKNRVYMTRYMAGIPTKTRMKLSYACSVDDRVLRVHYGTLLDRISFQVDSEGDRHQPLPLPVVGCKAYLYLRLVSEG